MPHEVLVLQHADPEPPGLIGEALNERGCMLRTVHVHHQEPVPTELAGAAGLVVMGGPMGVYEQAAYPHLGAELRLITAALAAEIPILGVCLGSQLLAAALGARVYPGPVKELGWYPLHLTPAAARDQLWQGEDADFTALAWHGDVFELPAGATLLASSAQVANHAFRYGASAYGLLFHVEATPVQVAGMTTAFAAELRDAGVDGAQLVADGAAHWPALQPLGRRVLGRWAALVAARP